MKASVFFILTASFFGFVQANAGGPNLSADEVSVTLKYVGSPRAQRFHDEDIISFFNATISSEALDFSRAEKMEFITPSLGPCQPDDYSFDLESPGAEVFSVSGFDPRGQKACQNFTKALERGFQMKLTNVPLLKGGVVKTVFLKVSAH